MTGQRKAVLGFQGWQTGKASICEETNDIMFVCRVLWFCVWVKSVSSKRRIDILPLGTKGGTFLGLLLLNCLQLKIILCQRRILGDTFWFLLLLIIAQNFHLFFFLLLCLTILCHFFVCLLVFVLFSES